MLEEWRDIPEYAGMYQASSLGRVRSIPHTVERSNGYPFPVAGRLLKPATRKPGYLHVRIQRKARLVHQLVASAFHGARPADKSDVNHLNGIKSDNVPGNLEWESRSGNTLHALDAQVSRTEQLKERLLDYSYRFDPASTTWGMTSFGPTQFITRNA